jgi:flagellar motor switch protein FliM
VIPQKAVAGKMVGTADNAGLRRKAQIARRELEARGMSPVRALRLAMEKAADEELALVLGVQSVQRRMLDHAALIAQVPKGALLLLLDGPDGVAGVMTLDAATLAAVIEMQTMGRVLARPAPERTLTRTDAAMAAPLVDGILRRLSQQQAEQPDAYWICGFHFGAMIDDRRSLGLALTATDYHHFAMQVDLGSSVRQGEMSLALPVRANPDQPRHDAAHLQATRQLQRQLLSAPVCLDAVLCRLSLPLAGLGKLAVGDVLPLPPDALREVALETAGRRRVATGRLGRIDGMRALRLNLGAGEAAQALIPPAAVADAAMVEAMTSHMQPSVLNAGRDRDVFGLPRDGGAPDGLPREALVPDGILPEPTRDPASPFPADDPLADGMAAYLSQGAPPPGLDGAYDDASFALDDGPQGQ